MTSPAAISLGRTAERFGQRPSALVGLTDEVLALDFDRAIHVRLSIADKADERSSIAEVMATMGQQRGSIAPDQRYETLDDLPPEIRNEPKVH